MIAFVGSCMANTVAVDEKKATEVDCAAVACAALAAADPNDEMSSTEAHNFFQGQFDACAKSTGQVGKKPVKGISQ